MAGNMQDLFFVMRTKLPEEITTLDGDIHLCAGDRVQVWSNSLKQWIDGVVDEVYATGGRHEGFWRQPGDVKVSWSNGWKFVAPANFGTSLRKISSAQSTKCKAVVEVARQHGSGSCFSSLRTFLSKSNKSNK